MGQRDGAAGQRVGTLLHGKYRLERLLGVGGMAAVYEGVHRNGNRVAVKVLHPWAATDAQTVTRFRREGYVANSLGHPGAVRVIDDDVAEDGAAFLVMELLAGESLGARARRLGGALPCREVLALARELCDVLDAAHGRGVIHRDVKPDNLFLTTGGALKVLDFGIARIAENDGGRATHTGATLGTPAFMPPEQALGHSRDVDARSDVWSAGATMFTLLSGQLVHEGETAAEVFVAAATRPSRSLATVAPDLPAPVVAVVDRALRFDRDERWPSARALGDAIEEAHRAAFGEPVDGVAAGLAAPPPSPRSPTELALAATEEVAPSLAPSSTAGGASPLADTARLDPGGDTREISATLPAVDPTPPPAASGGEPRPGVPPSPRRARSLALVLATLIVASLAATRLRTPASTPPVAPTEPARCDSNRSCTEAAGGRASVCRPDGACVALTSEDCHLLADPGDVAGEDTIWIGAMFPLSGADAALYGEKSMRSVDLARRDFVETVGGLPPARPGGPRRPLAVVACDDGKDPARAATHLVDALHVPVILGFARSKEVADLAASHFHRGGVLALASNTASMLRAIPSPPGQPRLVWRTTLSSDMRLAPLAALLSEVVEPELRSHPGLLATGEPVRVALIRIANASGLGTADGVVATLRFNGKSVAENGGAFRQVVYADVDDVARQNEQRSRVAAEISAYQPHVVLGEIDALPAVPEIERSWPRTARFRPRYLEVDLGSPAVIEHVRQHPEVRHRLFDVEAWMSTPVTAKLTQHYEATFLPEDHHSFAPYDAFYVAAYAISALGPEAITGPALARALPRLLPPGEPVDVGPAGIFAGLAALSAGRGIDLVGSMTTLDFDLTTGDPTADFGVRCLGPGSDGPLTVVESGLIFRARTGKLEGRLRCP